MRAAHLWMFVLPACCVAGLLVALYLSAVHLSSSVTLYCAQTSMVNCERVVTSPEASIAGIPVAFLGVVWFAVALVLSLPIGDARPWQIACTGWASAGALMVIYLVHTELFVIGAICLWCTAVHALVLIIFAIVVTAPHPPAVGPPAREASS